MNTRNCIFLSAAIATLGYVAYVASRTTAADETFEGLVGRLQKDKPKFAERQQSLLEKRYDLSDKPSKVTMSRGKPVQEGVRVKLPEGVTWD